MRLPAFLALALCAACAGAATPGPTNLAADYPKPTCMRPPGLPPPPPESNAMALQMWSMQVNNYNAARAEYVKCVKAYVAAAQGDVSRITETANALVEEANRP